MAYCTKCGKKLEKRVSYYSKYLGNPESSFDFSTGKEIPGDKRKKYYEVVTICCPDFSAFDYPTLHFGQGSVDVHYGNGHYNNVNETEIKKPPKSAFVYGEGR